MSELLKIKRTLELANQEFLGDLGYLEKVEKTNNPLGLELKE